MHELGRFGNDYFMALLFLSSGKTLADGIPVDDIVEGREIVSPPVLVMEVVGMLPDIGPQNR